MAASSNLLVILQDNPLILWGGIILAAIIFLIARHIENDDDGREAPEPTTLDKIVKPKVKEHLSNRGRQPKSETYFRIGRDYKGIVHYYADTELPNKLINPNPKEKSDTDDAERSKVRIVSVKPARRLERILQQIKAMFTRQEIDRKIYIFKKDSFLDTPDNDMIVDDDIMSYSYGGMEVELSDPSRNTINQAVQTVVAEKLLASLPNYTEKVDYLFPLHSQNMSVTREENKGDGDW